MMNMPLLGVSIILEAHSTLLTHLSSAGSIYSHWSDDSMWRKRPGRTHGPPWLILIRRFFWFYRGKSATPSEYLFCRRNIMNKATTSKCWDCLYLFYFLFVWPWNLPFDAIRRLKHNFLINGGPRNKCNVNKLYFLDTETYTKLNKLITNWRFVCCLHQEELLRQSLNLIDLKYRDVRDGEISA